MFKTNRIETVAALTMLTGVTALMPLAAHADNWRTDQQNTQANKNDWRNLTIGAGALAVVGLLTHNSTIGLIGAAGAAYSADRYEQERHSQSQEQNDWRGGWNYNDNRSQYHRFDGANPNRNNGWGYTR